MKLIGIMDVQNQQQIVHGKMRNGAQQKLMAIRDLILGLIIIGIKIGDIVKTYVWIHLVSQSQKTEINLGSKRRFLYLYFQNGQLSQLG